MSQIHRRDVLTVLLIALFASGLLALPRFDGLRGLSIDVLTWLRWATLGPRPEPARSPVVVVALDEETYNRKPFAGTPSIAWTREIGKVLTAIVDGGAKVVGLDIVFPTTIEQSEIPFGDETVGGRMRGFDRDFLRALASAGRAGKLVLGEIQAQDRPITPSDAQRVAVSHQRNIRPLNLYTDADGIVRRVPLTMLVGGARTPSMALELASRMQGTELRFDPEVMLGAYRVPANLPNTLTLNFEGGADEFPTYSLADLWQCLESGNIGYFSRQFAGRVVLIGAILDLEDRILTSKRFATGHERAGAERCTEPPPPMRRAFSRDTIAGVYVHATAVGNLLRQDALRELGLPAQWGIGLAVAAVASVAAMAFSPPVAALAVASGLLLWLAIGVAAFAAAFVLPIVSSSAAGVLALVGTITYRFMVTDKDKRLLRRNFAFYLAPSLIERMMNSNTPPTLGGETRVVSLYRSDIAGFSALSEKLTAAELVALMNEYLSAMTEIIGDHGGFVDKYIGDAIDGVFGAPVDDADHALNAVKAALACQAKLREMNGAGLSAFKGHQLRQRVGLHTGNGLVGNIGSRQRFNYTVMGDTANLASRLEGANKFYGTSIIASEETARCAGEAIVWRELDTIRVVGRHEAVRIFEPLAILGEVTPLQEAHAAAYAGGLERWRSADFPGALEAFGRFAHDDPAALRFRERILKQMQAAPGAPWTPVNHLESK